MGCGDGREEEVIIVCDDSGRRRGCCNCFVFLVYLVVIFLGRRREGVV